MPVMKFKCYDCNHLFDAKGKMKHYTDAVYGPCSKLVARCPSCGGEAIEHVVNRSRAKKSSGNLAPCGLDRSCSCCKG